MGAHANLDRRQWSSASRPPLLIMPGKDDKDEDGNGANPKAKLFEDAIDIAHLTIDDALDDVISRLRIHSPM